MILHILIVLASVGFFGIVQAQLVEPDTIITYYDRFDVAISFFEKGRYRLAQSHFQHILTNEKEFYDPAAQLMLAKSQLHQGKLSDADRTCRSFLNTFPNSPYELHAQALLGDISILKRDYSSAMNRFLSIRPSITDSLFLLEIDNRIVSCISIGLRSDQIEQILFNETNDMNRAILNLARGYRSMLDGDNYEARISIDVIGRSILPIQYQDMFNALNLYKEVKGSFQATVALILPLTGRDKIIGQTFLMGLADMVNDHKHDMTVNFQIYNNRSNDVKSLQLLKMVNLDRSIIAAMGPLSDRSAIAAAGILGSLPILISRTNLPDLPQTSEDLFLLSPSLEIQARFTARYLVNHLLLKNIAVIAPGDDEDRAQADYFLDELDQLGIDPVAIEWYHGKPENISRQFRVLRKTAWKLIPEINPNQDALDLEIDSLDALFDVDVTDFFELPKESDVETMNKRDSSKIVLETIHALYLPIKNNELAFVGTQLPMYNLNTLLVGNENWYDFDVLNQDVIGPHVQGLSILSSMSPSVGISKNANLNTFYSMGYDQGKFVNMITSQSSGKRRMFKDHLRRGMRFIGKSTVIQLSGKERNENQLLQILEYHGKQMKAIGIFDGNTLVNYKTDLK